MVVKKDYGMLLDNGRGTDWHREGTMPVLDEPYCYLLHDLLHHQKTQFNIFNINMIWIDIKYTDQKQIQLTTNGSSKGLKRVNKRKWKNVKSNSTDSNMKS